MFLSNSRTGTFSKKEERIKATRRDMNEPFRGQSARIKLVEREKKRFRRKGKRVGSQCLKWL